MGDALYEARVEAVVAVEGVDINSRPRRYAKKCEGETLRCVVNYVFPRIYVVKKGIRYGRDKEGLKSEEKSRIIRRGPKEADFSNALKRVAR